jgi:acyl-CoA thioester hydrolase
MQPTSPFPEKRKPAPAGYPKPVFRLERYEHGHPFRVRYADSDQMGVAYYANYLVWFEVGRTEWLRARGYAYRTLESEGVFLPVTEASCKYLAPLRYDDLVWVITRVGKLGRTVVHFDYQILKEDGTAAATGHTEHCFLSRDGRIVRAPEGIQRVLFEGLPPK